MLTGETSPHYSVHTIPESPSSASAPTEPPLSQSTPLEGSSAPPPIHDENLTPLSTTFSEHHMTSLWNSRLVSLATEEQDHVQQLSL